MNKKYKLHEFQRVAVALDQYYQLIEECALLLRARKDTDGVVQKMKEAQRELCDAVDGLHLHDSWKPQPPVEIKREE